MPMKAQSLARLPQAGVLNGDTVFEPKYDGFRMLVFAHDGEVLLQSQSLRDLTPSFPEVAEAAAALGEDVVLDGEVVTYTKGRLDFGALQQRLDRRLRAVARHRVTQPAHFIAFDLFERHGESMLHRPYSQRRAGLEALFADHALQPPWQLTPATDDRTVAEQWLTDWGGLGVEGVVAKGLEQPYPPGRRGRRKIRSRDTAEAVVAGITGPVTHPNSLLLGRWTATGRLRLVARTTRLRLPRRREMGPLLRPAGPAHPWWTVRPTTHWGSREPLTFTCVMPELVVEFLGDTAVDQGRWRHPVQPHRLRSDLTLSDVTPFD